MSDTGRSSEFHHETFTDADLGTVPRIEIHGEPADRAKLFGKLVQVNAMIPKLKHTGQFNAGKTKYTYATEADVLEPIAAALAENGLATVPSVVSQHWHDLPGKYGTNRVCTVHAQLMIGCADTGAHVLAHTYSTAANGDKASNAAFTTAIKYLLAKLTLVAFGDDADEYTTDGEKAAGPGAGKSKPKAKPKAKSSALTAKQRDDLMNKVVDADLQGKVREWLKAEGISWSKITPEQARHVEGMVASAG
jgi:hypothetical protein